MTPSNRPRILWIHPGGLLPVHGGGAARTWALIAYLREQGYAVELLTGHPGACQEALRARVDELWIDDHGAPAQMALQMPSRLRRVMKGCYLRVDPTRRLYTWLSGPHRSVTDDTTFLNRLRRPSLERYTGKVAYENPPVAAIASYAWLAPALDHLPPGTLRLLDTIDIQHLRKDNARAAGGNLAHITCSRDEEIEALDHADVLLAIQAEEGATLAAMCPQKEVMVVGHALRTPPFQPSPVGSQELLYVGNRYDPNVLGLHAFLHDVWPLVRQTCPAATLTVVGRVGECLRGHPRGVTVLGHVSTLEDCYRRAAVVINPVPYGSGLKIKTVEGLVQGRCVVCSPAGTGGLGAAAALPLVVAEVGPLMAAEIVRLLTNVEARHRLEIAAWEFAAACFSPEAVYGPLLRRIEAHRNSYGRARTGTDSPESSPAQVSQNEGPDGSRHLAP